MHKRHSRSRDACWWTRCFILLQITSYFSYFNVLFLSLFMNFYYRKYHCLVWYNLLTFSVGFLSSISDQSLSLLVTSKFPRWRKGAILRLMDALNKKIVRTESCLILMIDCLSKMRKLMHVDMHVVENARKVATPDMTELCPGLDLLQGHLQESTIMAAGQSHLGECKFFHTFFITCLLLVPYISNICWYSPPPFPPSN